MESASNVGRRDVRHDIFIIANIFTHVTIEVDGHNAIHSSVVPIRDACSATTRPTELTPPQSSPTHSSTLYTSSALSPPLSPVNEFCFCQAYTAQAVVNRRWQPSQSWDSRRLWENPPS